MVRRRAVLDALGRDTARLYRPRSARYFQLRGTNRMNLCRTTLGEPDFGVVGFAEKFAGQPSATRNASTSRVTPRDIYRTTPADAADLPVRPPSAPRLTTVRAGSQTARAAETFRPSSFRRVSTPRCGNLATAAPPLGKPSGRPQSARRNLSSSQPVRPDSGVTPLSASVARQLSYRRAISSCRVVEGSNAIPAAVQFEDMISMPVKRNMSMCRVPPVEIETYLSSSALGLGGTPRSQGRMRPSSAPLGGRPKTERYREAGELRWPPLSPGIESYTQLEATSFKQVLPQSQENWRQELWMRSLRTEGVPLEEAVFAENGAAGLKELHQEWSCPPFSARARPYCGATASGKVALPTSQDPGDWVERPVSTGTLALSHYGGNRYKWDQSPRNVCDQNISKVTEEGAVNRLSSSLSGSFGIGTGTRSSWDW